ncbi:hypothetical protein Pmar_PMAR003673 [Perkinsus marinus ATCC 50983]|uniref:GPI transamidase component PIG-S n=1 Tax=Perkinsus marinus (strain ATCC 50983 / TXsc) TaxID=423536 RepID=C5KHZ8_PERM5|nr:hypothetical protein Pmar_PMAR003673 [Perkinsus marinus ATCC 50983]EER16210.1 hypothetical protein Pmar_PMAR003673 [Perkinsus marinus ATCC 50983]|eukprot:XP_002784414.1 hypothetical protein Pmar_PMAR003673 [Perkinsus marinus ATCC 50983]
MAIVAVEVISIVFVCSWIKPMHTIKARHKAQISYGLVVVAMLLVWTWLQKVERHPLPQVDPMRDDGKHWPAVLVHSCSLDDSVVRLSVPSLRAPFGASVVDSCFNEEHRVALKRAGCATDPRSSSCITALRNIAAGFSGRPGILEDGLRYHVFVYSSSGEHTSSNRPLVLENFAIVDVRDHAFGVEWVYETVWFPARSDNFRKTMGFALSSPRQQLTFLLVNDAANSARAHWDFQHDVFDNYMKPLVDGYLQQIFDIEVDSQVVHGAVLPAATRKTKRNGVHRLRSVKQLRQLLTEASRWGRPETLKRGYRKLPHTIHLAAYVSPDNVTVTVGPADKSSVGIPGWGVVAFVQSVADHGYATGMWHAHLRAYLGFEPVPSCDEAVGWLCVDPTNGLTIPEVFELVREAIIFYRNATRNTLIQLDDLVESLPQVAVSQDIAARAAVAAHSIDNDLVDANEIGVALEMARKSYEESVDVLYDDSISASSYFSQEFTLAVYLPIAAPLLIPIVVNLLQEVRLWRRSRHGAEGNHEKID